MQLLFLFIGNCNITAVRNFLYTYTCKANLDDKKESFLCYSTYLSKPKFNLQDEKQNL